MTLDREELIALIRGELSPEDTAKLKELIGRDTALRERYEAVRRMEAMLRTSAADSFAPYFAERVMRRLAPSAAQRAVSLYESLRWAFLRLAVASLLVAIGLGAYNALDPQELDLSTSTLEAVFGLPADDLDSMYYLQGI